MADTTNEQGVQTVTSVDLNLAQIIKWEPQDIEIAPGITLPANMPDNQFRAVMALVSQYKTGDYKNIDPYLGRTLEIAGMLIHNVNMSTGDKQVVDVDTGEMVDFVTRLRTVIKVIAIDGKKIEPIYIGFVSGAADVHLAPYAFRYGLCDWKTTIHMRVSQVQTSNSRRTFSFEFLG